MPERKPQRFHQALAHPLIDKRVEILRAVGDAGSISAAARRCGVSYKAAWQAVDTLGNLAGAALLEKAVGGSGGGGARLTEAGAQLLRAAERLALADGSLLHARITRESAQLLGLAPGQRLLALCKATAVEMAAQPGAPAENCLRGEVQRVSRAREGGEVALKLPGGEVIVGFCGPASGLRLRGAGWALLPAAAVVLALPQ